LVYKQKIVAIFDSLVRVQFGHFFHSRLRGNENPRTFYEFIISDKYNI